jgi:hypothetical protein
MNVALSISELFYEHGCIQDSVSKVGLNAIDVSLSVPISRRLTDQLGSARLGSARTTRKWCSSSSNSITIHFSSSISYKSVAVQYSTDASLPIHSRSLPPSPRNELPHYLRLDSSP